MVARDVIFDRKLLEQRTLRHLPWTHHRRRSPPCGAIESGLPGHFNGLLFNSIIALQTFGQGRFAES
jgi:hypothetical protein